MQEKREQLNLAASSVLSRIRRLTRSSNPLCLGVFALSFTSLFGADGQALWNQPQKAPAVPLQAAAVESPAPPGTAPAPVDTPKAPAEDTAPDTAKVEPPAQQTHPAPAPSHPAGLPAATAQKPKPQPRRPTLDFDETLGVPPSPYGKLIYEVAVRHAVNPHLVAAVIHVESSFNPRAISRKGACGLMQLLPDTARRFGLKHKKEIFDPAKNLEAGVKYLKWLTRRFDGDVQRVLAAYNAGEGAVDRFGGVPPYRETKNYVQKIFGLLGFTTAAGPAIPVQPSQEEVIAAGR
ncbi:MAG TPA: transglycosylase SLT domain-containing protein [Thermoanaerobaculia bacterium]|nr:transglycosylase SLT domain-containing protein [Thermoanaerobaculia bacterium]